MARARQALQGRGSHVAITGASYGAHMPCGLQSVRLGADSPAVEGVHRAGMLCERKCDGRNQPRLLLLVMLPDLRTARHDTMCTAQHATCTRRTAMQRTASRLLVVLPCLCMPRHATPGHPTPHSGTARCALHPSANAPSLFACAHSIPVPLRLDGAQPQEGSHAACACTGPAPARTAAARRDSAVHTRAARCPLHAVRCTLSVAR